MSRFALVLPALVLLALALPQQQQTPQQQPSTPAAQNPSSTYAAIPVSAAKAPNPVKPTPESLARAKKWWTLDCAMCHGKDGDGKGETAQDMKLTIPDFTDPATLKDRTDGEIFWVIKNGIGMTGMPSFARIKVQDAEIWAITAFVKKFPSVSAEDYKTWTKASASAH